VAKYKKLIAYKTEMKIERQTESFYLIAAKVTIIDK
jgi:hypothetical protein